MSQPLQASINFGKTNDRVAVRLAAAGCATTAGGCYSHSRSRARARLPARAMASSAVAALIKPHRGSLGDCSKQLPRMVLTFPVVPRLRMGVD